MNSTEPNCLQIAIVDDDDAVRDSLSWLLEGRGFRTVAFESAEAFMSRWNDHQVGCLLLDIRMPGMTGIELHEWMLSQGHQVGVIFMTGHGDVPMAVQRMKKGAVDFLEKPFNENELCNLVQQVLERELQRRVALADQTHQRDKLSRLTQREAQVLERIVAGRLNKQIADDLNISIKTVEAHRANIMDKLEARTMADLMKVALNHRQVQTD